MPGPGADVTTQRFGRPFRYYPAAVSAEAMAQAWANQGGAEQGSVVVVTQEISARGRLGRIWAAPAESTLACAVVLRPGLAAEEADVAWLAGGVAAAAAGEAVSGRTLGTWWPDIVLDADSREEVAQVKADTQLGPGQVRSAVVTVRLDLERLGLGPERRDDLLEALVGAFDEVARDLADGPDATAAAYRSSCRQVGQRVKLTLLPKGEARGVFGGVDRMARLELQSATGMAERLTVDMVRDLTPASADAAPVPRHPQGPPRPAGPIPFGPPRREPPGL